MNSIAKAVRLQRLLLNQSRAIQTSAHRLGGGSRPHDQDLVERHLRPPKPENFDPNNYALPERQPTMEDLMEPYGPWEIAYAKERRKANYALLRGICAIVFAGIVFFVTGTADGLMMPNLDNLMEDTEPFEYDKEGRITV